jgi:hypothetical protein
VISVQLDTILAPVTSEADASAAGRLLLVLVLVVMGLTFIRLLVSVGRLIVAATVGLIRLVLSRVLLFLVALALVAAVWASPTGLADGLRPPERSSHHLPIARKRQDRHIEGTPQYRDRRDSGEPTSTWDEPGQADPLTREAWRNGTPVRGRPGLREWDAGRRVGAAPDGRSLPHIRVSRNEQGQIFGWPAG